MDLKEYEELADLIGDTVADKAAEEPAPTKREIGLQIIRVVEENGYVLVPSEEPT
jgi:hypothetical protein